MSKILKTTIATAVGVAAVGASAGHVANADTITAAEAAATPVAQSTTTTVAQDATTDFEKAQQSEAQKLEALKQQQAAEAQKKAEEQAAAEKLQAEKDAQAIKDAQAEQARKDAEAQAAHDAALAAAKAEAEKAAQEQAAAAAAAAAAEAAKQQQEADAFADKQAGETGSADDQRQEATTDYNSAVQDATNNAATVDTTIDQNAASATDAAQSQKDAADKAAADKLQADKNSTQAAGDKAVATQTQANKTSEDAMAKDHATSENKASQAVTNAQNAIDHPKAVESTPANTSNDPMDAYMPGHGISQLGELPTTIKNPNISAADKNAPSASYYYGDTSVNDQSGKIVGQPTAAQQKELADYAITLINSVRKQNGLAPVQWTQAVQQAVQKSAELRAAAGVGMVHTNALGNNDTQNFYNSLGLYLTSENLGQTIGTDLTMLGAKIAILNNITAMVYQDGAHGDGHLRNFLQPNLMMGFALQQYPDYYVLVFQGAQAMADSAPQVELALNATNQILEARGGDTPANRAALAAAQQALATLKANNAAAMNALKAANAQKITDIQNDTASKLAALDTAYQATLTTNANNFAAAVQTIKDDAAAQHQANAQELADTLDQLKAEYDAKMASIKDLTPEELAAKKAADKAAFDAKQAEALAAFQAKQEAATEAYKAQLKANLDAQVAKLASDLTLTKEQHAQSVADFIAQTQEAYQALVDQNKLALAMFKTQQAVDYDKAQYESNAYLDSINPNKPAPAPTEPSKPSTGGNATTPSVPSTPSNGGSVSKPSAPSTDNGATATPDVPMAPSAPSNGGNVTNTVTPSAKPGANATVTNTATKPSNGFVYDAATGTLFDVVNPVSAQESAQADTNANDAADATTFTAGENARTASEPTSESKTATKHDGELPHAGASKSASNVGLVAAAVAALVGIAGVGAAKFRKQK